MNITVNPIDLTGYLTYGKFNVNDYVFELGRGTDAMGKSGMVLSVFNSEGDLLDRELCYDGEPGLTEQERADIMDLFDRMSDAFPEWQTAEEDRAAAEEARKAAEGTPSQELERLLAVMGTDTDPIAELIKSLNEDPDALRTRYGLFEAMLKMYRDILKRLEEEKAARDAAQAAAEAAARAAAEAADAAQSAVAAVFGDEFKSLLFYSPGEVISFTFTPEANEYRTDAVTDSNNSLDLAATGYVTEDRTVLHIKIPLGKLLTSIVGVEVSSFTALVHNSGGYGLVSGFNKAGQDYLPYLTARIVDKVQNCIHFIFRKQDRFPSLVNNQPVTCRAVGISFTLLGPSDTEA